ncbi:hypothetical protein, partial [Streptomyces microflavus]
MPRSIALGMLLFMVESAVHHDSDRLDHEQVRAGYLSGILSALQDLPEKDRTDASGGVWVALLRERAHRSWRCAAPRCAGTRCSRGPGGSICR